MVKLNMSNFWQGKKVAALILSVVVVVVTMVLNNVEGFSIDANVILSILGLNAIYILRQGSIDSKKTDANVFKPFWESRKFLAIALGNIMPMIVEYINSKYKTGITSEMVLGLLGVDAIYMLRQGAIDVKEPDKH